MDDMFLSYLTSVDDSKQDILFDLLRQTYTRIALVDIKDETLTNIYDATGTLQKEIKLTYAQALENFLFENIMEEDRYSAQKALSLDALREFYHSGVEKKCLEFRSLAKEYVYEWREMILTTASTKQPDIIYILLKNINEQKLMSGIIDRFIYHDCDYFIYLDVKKDSYTMFSHSDSGTPLPPVVCNSYSTEIVKYADEFVVPEDRDYTIKQMSLEQVVKQLDDRGEHFFYVGIADPVRGYTRKCLKYVYYDKENQMVLLIRTDVTDIYLKEQKKQKDISNALRIAEEANRSKSQFFAQMSHELRTPMNAIIGLNEIMKTNLEDKPFLSDCIAKSQSASEYLLSLLNDMLDLSSVETGRLKLVNQPFSLFQLLKDINTMILPTAEKNHVKYSFESQGSLKADYDGDKIRVQQILVNLLNNAIKFTPESGSVVFKAIISPKADQDSLRFIVRDSGVGISPDFMPRLFDAFAQERSAASAPYAGSGLGLSISHELVTMMGGTIEVESEPGKGSTFTVNLSLQRYDDPSIKEVSTSYSAEQLSGRRVLLVEDHPMNAMIARKLLEQKGMLVEHAQNGKEGVDIFENSESGHFDAILMDIRMPVMDGLTATREIRGLPHGQAKTIPIIAMTANAFEEDREKTKAAGMQAHLAKPIRPENLFDALTANIFNNSMK
ncbi:MAG: ATP-binding protein [Lachnospiraceae bacterium]|nr:ATP-binding protein [Lachnospiraceae bacterium]